MFPCCARALQTLDAIRQWLGIANDVCWPRLQEIRPATALKWAIVAYPDDTLPKPVRWLARYELRRSGGWVDVRHEERTYFFQEMLDFATQPAPPIAVTRDDRALVRYLQEASGPPTSAPLTHRDLVAVPPRIASR